MQFKIEQECEACEGSGHRVVVNHHALRQRRKYKKLRLREVARRLEISAPYLSDIERGRRPCPERVEKFYKELLK